MLTLTDTLDYLDRIAAQIDRQLTILLTQQEQLIRLRELVMQQLVTEALAKVTARPAGESPDDRYQA